MVDHFIFGDNNIRETSIFDSMIPKKCMLMILDGWGIGPDPKRDAIASAATPIMDGLMQDYPSSTLTTYGLEVGLPTGQMGNSEVGHLNIGAGRVVYQELARINKAIEDDTLKGNPALQAAIALAKSGNRNIHLMGLLSDGGVHSHIDHLLALTDIMEDAGVEHTYIHAFMDGRDTSPTGGKAYLQKLLNHTEGKRSTLATVIGRYYAMDRDKRWERTKLAYDLLVHGESSVETSDILSTVQACYDEGTTDEFMPAIQLIDESDQAFGNISEDDIVLFFNFRTDRPRQITEVLTQTDFPDFDMKAIGLHFFTMTSYDASFKDIHILFEKENLNNTLGEVLANAGKSQVRAAETEKYPHVTFFFSGGREDAFDGEDRILKASPKVATYDLAPEMSAHALTKGVIDKIESDQPDFIILNFANTDMVGHTGDFKAAMKAAEVVDECVGKLIKTLDQHDYRSIIIADHGNSDYMINDDGTPHTAHTTNPVPVILVGKDVSDMPLKAGKLGDIAPTVLDLMGVAAPEEMTGSSLIS